MNIWFTIFILAAVQGITEFLPVSSSGHLALISAISGLSTESGATMSIVLHGGSLLAIAVFYFKTLIGFFKKDQLNLLKMVIVATIPAAVAGLLLKKSGLIDVFFGDMLSVALGFLITASILRLTGKEKLRAKSETDLKDISLRQAIIVGISQAVAIIPGISRSGSTIAAGILSGIKFEAAATFSFLLALPVIAGALLLETVDLVKNGFTLDSFNPAQLAFAFILSATCSLASLSLLVTIIRKKKLSVFSWYLFFLGSAVMIWQIISISKG